MGRRRSYVSSLAARQRAAAQVAQAQARAEREVERLQRQRERERLADERANEKEQLRLFHEHQEEDMASRNEDLTETRRQFSNLLRDAVGTDHRLNFEALKKPLKPPEFNSGPLGKAEEAPSPENYLPRSLGLFARLIPGAKSRHQRAIREARIRFDADVEAHRKREKARQFALLYALLEHKEKTQKLAEQAARQRAQVDALQRDYEAGKKEEVRQYGEAVLSSLPNADKWPDTFKVAFVAESKQLVVEYDLPPFEIVPEIAAYKYVRSRKETVATRRSEAERRRTYSNLIAQASLRVVHVLFSADYAGQIESIVFNGHVDAVNQATGHQLHPCLVTLRTTRAAFSDLDLARVDPQTCLKGLNASVSKRPSELAPVKPVLEFSMVDPRFVQEEEILSGLDNRTNLMNLTPREFESGNARIAVDLE
jgi:restriction system protein